MNDLFKRVVGILMNAKKISLTRAELEIHLKKTVFKTSSVVILGKRTSVYTEDMMVKLVKSGRKVHAVYEDVNGKIIAVVQ